MTSIRISFSGRNRYLDERDSIAEAGRFEHFGDNRMPAKDSGKSQPYQVQGHIPALMQRTVKLGCTSQQRPLAPQRERDQRRR